MMSKLILRTIRRKIATLSLTLLDYYNVQYFSTVNSGRYVAKDNLLMVKFRLINYLSDHHQKS